MYYHVSKITMLELKEKNLSIGSTNWFRASFEIETILQAAMSVGKVGAITSGTECSAAEMLLHLHECICLMCVFPLKWWVTTYRNCVSNWCAALKYSGKNNTFFCCSLRFKSLCVMLQNKWEPQLCGQIFFL